MLLIVHFPTLWEAALGKPLVACGRLNRALLLVLSGDLSLSFSRSPPQRLAHPTPVVPTANSATPIANLIRQLNRTACWWRIIGLDDRDEYLLAARTF